MIVLTASTLLALAAVVLFTLAAFGVSSRVHLGWLGAALLTIALLVVSF